MSSCPASTALVDSIHWIQVAAPQLWMRSGYGRVNCGMTLPYEVGHFPKSMTPSAEIASPFYISGMIFTMAHMQVRPN